MNFKKSLLLCLGLLATSELIMAQPAAPAGKAWQLIPELSDEFNNGFDSTKWAKNSPTWSGRKPGLFKESAVTVADGNLRITADVLPANEQVDGWSHQGGLVRSIQTASASDSAYFETSMKANKTFMSSTFWLINNRGEGSGCDRRVTELDITETVGANSGGQSWINNTMRKMNSNTHSRNVSCGETVAAKGDSADLGELASANYHTYGAWWKSPSEVIFYLDGVEQFTVNPPADFSIDMYLRMVVETYDWNPPPAGGGMGASFNDRTTHYDWVRSYRLVDDNSNSSSSSSSSSSTSSSSSSSGAIIDQCNTTSQCKTTYGNQATDCKNSRSNSSICMCGSETCEQSTSSSTSSSSSSTSSSSSSSTSSSSSGAIIDQCNTTSQCKTTYGNQANDCKNSRSNTSVCMCGSTRCDSL